MTSDHGNPETMEDGARHVLLANHALAVRVAIAFWVFGGALFVVVAIPALADLVQITDDAAYDFAIWAETDVLVFLAKVLDVVGGVWVVTPVILIVTTYLAWRKKWEAFSVWISAMVLSQMLVGPVKLLYARPRPPMPLVETNSYSFPSGHATAGASIAIALVIVLVPAGPARRGLGILAVLFAVAMALSRVYLRAHWMSDAVAGVSMGAAAALSAAAVVQLLWDRKEESGRWMSKE